MNARRRSNPRTRRYDECVFINAPFDRAYQNIFQALVFAVHDCGFVARCALEAEDSSSVRVERIYRIIEESKYGIHDISRAGLDSRSRLARFNMPLELGIFLGAKRYGSKRDRDKICLVLDSEKYRYQKFCSDIAGQDVRAHGSQSDEAIKAVRDWLSPRAPRPSQVDAELRNGFNRSDTNCPLRLRRHNCTVLNSRFPTL